MNLRFSRRGRLPLILVAGLLLLSVANAGARSVSDSVDNRGPADVDADGIADVADNCVEVFNPDQRDTDDDGFGNICDADLDNDGSVNFNDLAIMEAAFFGAPASPQWNPDADLNGDDIVNFADLLIMKISFFGPPGPIANVFAGPTGGSWHDPDNWSLGVEPTAAHSVRIDVASGDVVTYSAGTAVVAGLRTTSPLILSGGDLSVSGTAQFNDTFTLDGGSLSDATIIAGAGIITVPRLANPELVAVTLGAEIIIEGRLEVPGGLTLDNGIVRLGASGFYIALLDFVFGDQELGGVGEVIFDGSHTDDQANRVTMGGFGSLTVGPEITFRTGTGGGAIGYVDELILQATVVSDLPGRNVVISSGSAALSDSTLQSVNGGGFLLLVGNGTLIDVPVDVTDGGSLVVSGNWVNVPGNSLTVSGGGNLHLDGLWTNSVNATIAIDGGEAKLHGTWENYGSITVVDGLLDTGWFQSGMWANFGVIDAGNSPVALGGAFDVANIGAFSASGDILFDAHAFNAGGSLDFGNLFDGQLTIGDGAAVSGGQIVGAPFTVPFSAEVTLSAVTLATDVVVDNAGTLKIVDGLTLGAATVTLASAGSPTRLDFDGVAQTLGGTGEIVFAGNTSRDTENVIDAGQIVTIGPGITIRTDTTGGTIRSANLQATVISSLVGRSVRVLDFEALTGSTFRSLGGGFYFGLQYGAVRIFDTPIEVGPGGSLTINGPWVNAPGNVLSVSGGGDLDLRGSWINSAGGVISQDGGELFLGGDWENHGHISVADGLIVAGGEPYNSWSNQGVIDAGNSPVELAGSFSVADVGTFISTGDVTLTGTVENVGMTVDLQNLLPGNVSMSFPATVVGGTVAGTPFSIDSYLELDSVTLATDIVIQNGADLKAESGLSLDNSTVTLASDGDRTEFRVSLLDGTGQVVFGGTTLSDSDNEMVCFCTMTIGPDVTIRTGTAGGEIIAYLGLEIQGMVLADLAGRAIAMDGDPAQIGGTLAAGAGAEIAASEDFTLSDDAMINIEIAGPGLAGTGRVTALSYPTNPTVELAGTLNVALAGGYTPSACAASRVMDWRNFNGAFGTVNGPDLDGGETFQPYYSTVGLDLLAPTPDGCTVNLSLQPGAVAGASSDLGSPYVPALAIDADNRTVSTWCTATGDPSPYFEVDFPGDITFRGVNILSAMPADRAFTTGRFEAFDAADVEVYDSGVVTLEATGEISFVTGSDIGGVQRVRFSGVTWNGSRPCISEFEVMGRQP